MSEYDRALRDVRADIIAEVADSMPGAKASAMVAAIVTRLNAGLPRLVEVELEVRS
jgi:hypothetical protein